MASVTRAARPLPRLIGPFRIRRILGEGGTALVYLAEQIRSPKRMVALKVLKSHLVSEESVVRFEKELQTLAMLNHPNIAQVYDFSARGRETPYFTMEYVEGRSLIDYCDHERLSVRERLALFLQVCNAVQYVHQNGIIHRDLKPSNIVVTKHDGRPLAKLLDFGLAKLTDELWESSRNLTRSGQAMGTLCYMSPEQAGLTEEALDTRTDVYSLGVILYELIAGALPFDQPKGRAGYAEFLRQTRDDTPPHLSARLSRRNGAIERIAEARATDKATLLRQVRGDLDWIASKVLEKSLSRRYGTVSEFKRDIRAHLDAEPVHARPPTSSYRIARAMHRHRGRVVVVATLFVTLSITATLGTLGYLRLDAEHQRRVELLRLTERIQVRAANAHLWFEELLAGDESIDLQRDVVRPLNTSAAELGDSLRSATAATSDRWRRLRDDVVGFREATEERWRQRHSAGATGRSGDQLYDENYKSILLQSRTLSSDAGAGLGTLRRTLARLLVAANVAVLGAYLLVSILAVRFWGKRAQPEVDEWI